MSKINALEVFMTFEQKEIVQINEVSFRYGENVYLVYSFEEVLQFNQAQELEMWRVLEKVPEIVKNSINLENLKLDFGIIPTDVNVCTIDSKKYIVIPYEADTTYQER